MEEVNGHSKLALTVQRVVMPKESYLILDYLTPPSISYLAAVK
jgi:hypothetical protein